MNAMLVIKTKNGFAVAPYEGEAPANFLADMEVAGTLNSYSSRQTVLAILENFFEPVEPVQLKEAA